jgi:hypothetical protein
MAVNDGRHPSKVKLWHAPSVGYQIEPRPCLLNRLLRLIAMFIYFLSFLGMLAWPFYKQWAKGKQERLESLLFATTLWAIRNLFLTLQHRKKQPDEEALLQEEMGDQMCGR